jgi:ferritin-like metal-binding protein YciE
MGLLSHTFNNLNDLLVHELGDLYDAEYRLTEALPKMAEAASSQQLKSAFQDHLRETEQHVHRLEQVFDRIGCSAKRETCPAMKGLIAEGEQMISATGNDKVRDAGLIGAAQRVEHYEIAAYGTARNFAQQLGMSEVAQILQQTLDEEGACDKKLTSIAESFVNSSTPQGVAAGQSSSAGMHA